MARFSVWAIFGVSRAVDFLWLGYIIDSSGMNHCEKLMPLFIENVKILITAISCPLFIIPGTISICSHTIAKPNLCLIA
jgi:hypothetical protein